jgi:hypothetical protein
MKTVLVGLCAWDSLGYFFTGFGTSASTVTAPLNLANTCIDHDMVNGRA